MPTITHACNWSRRGPGWERVRAKEPKTLDELPTLSWACFAPSLAFFVESVAHFSVNPSEFWENSLTLSWTTFRGCQRFRFHANSSQWSFISNEALCVAGDLNNIFLLLISIKHSLEIPLLLCLINHAWWLDLVRPRAFQRMLRRFTVKSTMNSRNLKFSVWKSTLWLAWRIYIQSKMISKESWEDVKTSFSSHHRRSLD